GSGEGPGRVTSRPTLQRSFATAAARHTQSGYNGKAVRPAWFLRIPRSIFDLYTEQMSSIVEGNFWHFPSLPAVRGGWYGASDCHLHTPGSQPYGALHRDRGAPGDLSRLAR